MRLKASRDQAEMKKQTREGSNNESAYEASRLISAAGGAYMRKSMKGDRGKGNDKVFSCDYLLVPCWV